MNILKLLLAWSVLCVALHAAEAPAPPVRPNILWLIAGDMSPHFGCYGEKTIQTPNVDKLAAGGVLFERAFVTGPICSPSRSALITGMYQTSVGAQHHRSGVGTEKIELPADVQLVPLLFQQAGYHTSNGGYNPVLKKGKTDYNFEFDPGIYDGTDCTGRKPGQPFFAQIQLLGGKTRDLPAELAKARQKLGNATPTNKLSLPPYYPRTPAIPGKCATSPPTPRTPGRCKSFAPTSTAGWNKRTTRAARPSPTPATTPKWQSIKAASPTPKLPGTLPS